MKQKKGAACPVGYQGTAYTPARKNASCTVVTSPNFTSNCVRLAFYEALITPEQAGITCGIAAKCRTRLQWHYFLMEPQTRCDFPAIVKH